MNIKNIKEIFISPRTLRGVDADRDWRIILFIFIAVNVFSMILNVNYFRTMNNRDFFSDEEVATRSPLNVEILEETAQLINMRAVRYAELVKNPPRSVDPS